MEVITHQTANFPRRIPSVSLLKLKTLGLYWKRDSKEHRINLTKSQGMILYNLPFPNAEFLSIAEVMEKADVGSDQAPEVLDIVELLVKYGVIEEKK